MGVKVRRLVMQSVSETDGIARMKFLGEFPHDFLQAGMQKVVGLIEDLSNQNRESWFCRSRHSRIESRSR